MKKNQLNNKKGIIKVEEQDKTWRKQLNGRGKPFLDGNHSKYK